MKFPGLRDSGLPPVVAQPPDTATMDSAATPRPAPSAKPAASSQPLAAAPVRPDARAQDAVARIPALAVALPPLPVPEPAPRMVLAALRAPAFPALAARPAAPEQLLAGLLPPAPAPLPALWAGDNAVAVPAVSVPDATLPRPEPPPSLGALPRPPDSHLVPLLPPPQQPAAAPLPAHKAPPGYFVSVFVSNSVPEGGMANAVAALVRAGYQISQPARVQVSIPETDLRYFHRQDAETAHALARELGGVARDFTTAAKKPRPGRLELWLGGPSQEAQAPVRTTRPATQPATIRRNPPQP
ncbi:LytR C-terminal domain-containing protein [Rhodovulum strictum]|uniref:LytR cell envelope-related transcriptional attenuator n=1 Tax=Rhodovulum strictum TaxID=58314 RepID=A0A844BD19_9RHOB|nr:LytR C-terminal domain-containing protein [Rhodovulum strictum]MRH20498.1 hypothetical protein [Rhodovulum strictum]